MRYVIHVMILVCSLIGGSIALMSALDGESGWNGVIIAGIVFGFAAGNLTLLEIRNWVRASGHRQQSRLWRLLSAPVMKIEQPHHGQQQLPTGVDPRSLSSEDDPALLSDRTDGPEV